MKKLSFFLFLFLLNIAVFAQKTANTPQNSKFTVDSSLYNGMQFRLVGAFRGGRSAAVTGTLADDRTFYMGSTGGGVWKTQDGGETWNNISDGFFGGSIGAVSVSDSDPNMIYVGGGEKTLRGNMSYGYGMFKSFDAGKTWQKLGLERSRHISRIRIHPQNPNIVWVAVLGNAFANDAERGVFMTEDGGKTWQKTLYVSDKAGAVDLVVDPKNPRILYASLWQVRRKPHTFESGGEDSGLYKSTDGGKTWSNISRKKGLPAKSTLGIIGVTVSPQNSNRVWALVEASDGGLFESQDAGETWTKINEHRSIRQRAWYYTRLYADPQQEEVLYILNVDLHRSKDGGKTFETIDTPHGDHHDFWINPRNNNTLIVGDDGGAQVSFNKGKSFSTYHNQPTAQYYRVTTDNSFPYRIYVAQQDNSTLRIRHRSNNQGITEKDWEITAGGESGHIAPDPKNNEVVYGGSYGGYLTRFDHRNGEDRLVDVYPNNVIGAAGKDIKYRFQWNFPIFFSPHDPNTLYCAAQHLFRSQNDGQSWEMISPDLTRNDTTKLLASGGAITKDNTSVEMYCTIFAACESALEKGTLWTGSDDGLIHVSRDAGKNWTNVTPPKTMLPEWTQINSIEPHPFEKGGLYVAATLYKGGDFKPYLFRTTDYGKTWVKITNGIDNEHFTRVIRADKTRKGLLWAGTESGLYVSFDDGSTWQAFQLNLPIVPITDMTWKDNDLIVATQGRSLWILDDLSPLQKMQNEDLAKNIVLYPSKPAWRYRGGTGNGITVGKNPKNGAIFHFYCKNVMDSTVNVRFDILEKNGKLIRSFRNNAKPEELEKNKVWGKIEAKKGFNEFAWDMMYPSFATFKGLILWGGSGSFVWALPDTYKAKLVVGKDSTEIEFELRKAPNIETSDADLKAQFDFLVDIRDKVDETHQTILSIRKTRTQLNDLKSKMDKEKHKDLLEKINTVSKQITSVEENLYATKLQSGQDVLNYSIRLNNKLSILGQGIGGGQYKPTDQSVSVKNELIGLINKELAIWKTIKTVEIPALNEAVRKAEVPVIKVE